MDMEWFILAFLLIGIIGGLVVGVFWGYDRCYEKVFVKIRSHVEGLCVLYSRDVEDTSVIVSAKQRLMDLGKREAYLGLLEYMDNEFVIENKKEDKEETKDERID